MSRHHERTRLTTGFSLIEVMVGIAIGLLGVLVVMQVSVAFEEQKRTTTTGADTQSNGITALHTVERDVRKAGYGMNLPGAFACEIKRYYASGVIGSLTMAPITITNGVGGRPDSIRILASAKEGWSLPSRVTVDHPPQATNIFLNTTLGMDVGDMLVIYEPGKTCTLIQATGIPNGNVQVHHQNTSVWNPPGGAAVDLYPPGGYNVGAIVFNMGAVIDHTYSINAASNLLLTEYVSITNTSNVVPLAADIVNMQAQYGFDTRAGVQTDSIVDTWSATMVDADGNGVTGDAGDLVRIAAVRMAMVARSPLMEKMADGAACDITRAVAAGGLPANAPTWVAGAIDVSINPDGSDSPNWRCYRYTTFENTIPLRNLIWRET